MGAMRFNPPWWLVIGLGLFALSALVGAVIAPQPGPAQALFAQICLAASVGLGVWALGRRWPLAMAWGLTLGGAWVIPLLTFLMGWGRNTRGGLMAWLLPFALAATVEAWAGRGQRSRWQTGLRLGLGGASTGLILLFLLSSGSRGAVVALILALGVVGALAVTGGWRWMAVIRTRLPLIAVGVLAAANLALIYAAGPFSSSINALDVGGADMGRLSIWRETWYLIGEAPWTGFGLASFEGVFSHYARLIQVPLFTYAHQLYLGVWVQQGLFGVAGLGVLLGGALGVRATEGPGARATNDPEDRFVGPSGSRVGGRSDCHWLAMASLASTLSLALHGLVDDSVYGNGGQPFLFVWAGMAAALQARRPSVSRSVRPSVPPPVRFAALAAGLVLLLMFGRSLLASAWVNAGAVTVARGELADWPRLQAAPEAVLAAAQADFEQGLAIDPGDRAGHFRLGLILMERGAYADAARHLTLAYDSASDSRATRKALGLALTWSGDIARAVELLTPLPEARTELEAYAFYWQSTGQSTLSQHASHVADRLP
jgi:O-antigen ligase